jgi:tRNA 2-selenouridine synthase
MITRISAAEFLEYARVHPVIDVRSEKEYFHGHIPGAINLPLFNNEERAVVGTLYKNSGREASVLKGLELAGPKLADFIKQLHKLTGQKKILVHCWRGGMRSESMAWLFEVAGYEVFVMKDGYKAYRRLIRERFSRPANIIILGGLTGSGKTEILHQLRQMGEQVLDLEALACHKGSVFGGFGQPDQPANEQFENDIFTEWGNLNPAATVWIEDESRMIGNVSIPDPLFEQMCHSPMIKIETTGETRIRRLVAEYSKVGKQDLKNAVIKISEKLGGTHTKTALAAIDDSDFETVAGLALMYYDKTYAHSIQKRKNPEIHTIPVESDNTALNAERILEAGKFIKRNNC